MTTIWKFDIPVEEYHQAEMPAGAEILSVGSQRKHTITVWARVDANAPTIIRKLPIYGTGHRMFGHDQYLPFIGTVFDGTFVWHVFDGGEALVS